MDATIECISAPALLGESPMWHPDEQALYWCDIPGHALHRFDPRSRRSERWAFDTDVGCCAPAVEGGLLLALRSGFWHFDPASGGRTLIDAPPYDPAGERFNDGKADASGRLWCGTLCDVRDQPLAALYCLEHGRTARKAEGITISNGLAWSPDGRTMYWADSIAHVVFAFDFDVASGAIGKRRVFRQFRPRAAGEPLTDYLGAPDGAAVDVEGNYWLAMYGGQRLLQLGPDGALLRAVALPVRCPTMPCFGGADLKTLYITSAREGMKADELAQRPWSGCVLSMRVDVPGLPVNFARLT
jgi:sugar lactone lactonase YvrE